MKWYMIEAISKDGVLHVVCMNTVLTPTDMRRAAVREKKLRITAIWQLTP